MNSRHLILRSKAHFRQYPTNRESTLTPFIFTEGAKWMTSRLNELDGKKRSFRPGVPYELYGYLKYLFCLIFFLFSGLFFWTKAIYLCPLAILIFYFFEVHLLFLFPLLIDGVENPLAKGIQMAYKVGVLTAMKNILPIGVYMVVGLLNWRNPLQNWYEGCLAVLIWYVHESD